MNKAEARALALARVAELRQLYWSELRDRYLQRPETLEVSGPSGATYQVETEALWDGGSEGNLRVSVMVDDGAGAHSCRLARASSSPETDRS